MSALPSLPCMYLTTRCALPYFSKCMRWKIKIDSACRPRFLWPIEKPWLSSFCDCVFCLEMCSNKKSIYKGRISGTYVTYSWDYLHCRHICIWQFMANLFAYMNIDACIKRSFISVWSFLLLLLLGINVKWIGKRIPEVVRLMLSVRMCVCVCVHAIWSKYTEIACTSVY